MVNFGLKRCIKAVMAILLAVSISPGCATKDETFTRQLTEWKIAPAVSATTPALNAIAVKDDAAKSADYSTSDWLKAVAPGTVLGNLVDDGVYNDIFQPDNDGEINEYFNDNLSRIPEGDFENQWWYSTDFTIPSGQAGKKIILTFKGIS